MQTVLGLVIYGLVIHFNVLQAIKFQLILDEVKSNFKRCTITEIILVNLLESAEFL